MISKQVKEPLLANSIRRSILSHVPNLAVHVVEFFENNTTYPDGFLAHRLAMVTIRSRSLEVVKRLKVPSACNCDGKKCSKCSIEAYLHVVNKSEATSMPITWGSIKIDKNNHQDVSIANPDQVLCMLAAGKELRCRMWIMRGTHEEHGKWAVATVVAFPRPGVISYEPSGSLPASDIWRGAIEALIVKLLNLQT